MGTVTALGGSAAESGLAALDGLISQRRLWRGQSIAAAPALEQPTGWPALDAALATRGWPAAALSELLLSADGIGELQLLWPTLARLSQPKDGVIALIAPPYRPYPPAWQAAGVRLGALQVIRTKTPRDALWAAEQCLRSGACDAVLCWPQQADDRALRRLQVAAETGQALGFAFRPMKAALNPSPAALRIALDAAPRQLRVLKCRGGIPSARAIPFPPSGHQEPSLRHMPAISEPLRDAPAIPAPLRHPEPFDYAQDRLREGPAVEPRSRNASAPRNPVADRPNASPFIRAITPRHPPIASLFPLASTQDASERTGSGA